MGIKLNDHLSDSPSWQNLRADILDKEIKLWEKKLGNVFDQESEKEEAPSNVRSDQVNQNSDE